jgi:dTDP-4-dehydrorhamnose reductase
VEGNAQLAFTVNAHSVAKIANYCNQRNIRFLHCSTDYVFGGQFEKIPLDENSSKAPLNVYGASKAVGEDLAISENHDTIIVRVSSLFGLAGASGKGGNFVETMIRLARENGALKVVADQTMVPTATADAAVMILSLLTKQAPSGVYHCVNSGTATWHEFASEIMGQLGSTVNVIPISTADTNTTARRPPYSALSNKKISRLLGPPRPWKDALNKYLYEKGHIT